MLSKRGTVRTMGVAAFLLLCGFGLVCCTQNNAPSMNTSEPPVNNAATPPAKQYAEPAPTRESETTAPPPEINMSKPPEPPTTTPRYLAIMEEFQSGEDSQVRATLQAPSKLVLETKNIKRLRITREGLPLSQNRSIVLQIDGQGIEWTRQYQAVELEKSTAGQWSVVRRKPINP